uniref:Uncharacterized protein n=1 Tax=Kwoniella dejecticola CBS 10117 TaxID=1296121 RepID=A0A1A6A7M7_9TREE|nr:uncharacterized protein I303_03776 [Kwoniella dejecticola CBS 10117]OBR86058.1 hypothetical protein I303_03776 [Kwoniella dejecticola CBS 10117]
MPKRLRRKPRHSHSDASPYMQPMPNAAHGWKYLTYEMLQLVGCYAEKKHSLMMVDKRTCEAVGPILYDSEVEHLKTPEAPDHCECEDLFLGTPKGCTCDTEDPKLMTILVGAICAMCIPKAFCWHYKFLRAPTMHYTEQDDLHNITFFGNTMPQVVIHHTFLDAIPIAGTLNRAYLHEYDRRLPYNRTAEYWGAYIAERLWRFYRLETNTKIKNRNKIKEMEQRNQKRLETTWEFVGTEQYIEPHDGRHFDWIEDLVESKVPECFGKIRLVTVKETPPCESYGMLWRSFGCFMPEGERVGWATSRMGPQAEKRDAAAQACRMQEMKKAASKRRASIVRERERSVEFIADHNVSSKKKVRPVRDVPPHLTVNSVAKPHPDTIGSSMLPIDVTSSPAQSPQLLPDPLFFPGQPTSTAYTFARYEPATPAPSLAAESDFIPFPRSSPAPSDILGESLKGQADVVNRISTGGPPPSKENDEQVELRKPRRKRNTAHKEMTGAEKVKAVQIAAAQRRGLSYEQYTHNRLHNKATNTQALRSMRKKRK